MNEFDAIFDGIIQFGKTEGLLNQIKEKQAQINSVKSLKCGNCDNWMKSTCIPEKQYKQFKSCKSYACKNFISWSVKPRHL